MTVLDAHLHIWDRSRSGYPWITPAVGPDLDRDILPAEAAAALAESGVDRAILVQADDALGETRYLLEVAHAEPWVAGVVGWLPLDDEGAARAALDGFEGEGMLRGIRHLVHDDPRDDFLDLPAVRASLAAAAEHGLVFDVPDAWPRHLAAARRLAEELPQLTVVIDHLAKPPVGAGVDSAEFGAWLAEFRAVAALPNTVAKFSGLRLPGVGFDDASVGALLGLALDAFGADRLMYGGDWPMSLTAGGYAPTWQVMRGVLDAVSPDEREDILHRTAERVYLDANIRPLTKKMDDSDRDHLETSGNIR